MVKLIYSTKRYLSDEGEIPDISELSIGDQLEIPVGNKVFTATAVKEKDGGMLFVFDDIVGESSMTNMQSFLDKFYQKLPENLKIRMGRNNLRLLDASEVFYQNVPSEWEQLCDYVEMRNSPIHQMREEYYRALDDTHWWLQSAVDSDAVPFLFVYVGTTGDACVGEGYASLGVRPVFTIY